MAPLRVISLEGLSVKTEAYIRKLTFAFRPVKAEADPA